MKKVRVMSQDDLYNAIRSNFGEVKEAEVGKGMNVGTSTVTKIVGNPNTTTITNGKSTIVVKDTEIILSGTRITIEGKATIHLDD